MNSLSEIHQLHDQVAYWHGTGRYRYQEENGSKYTGVKYCTVADTLKDIFQEGLKPNYDLFNKRGWIESQDISHTLSLSPHRIYARLYAELFEYEKDVIKYRDGSRKFHWKKIGLTILLSDKELRKRILDKTSDPEAIGKFIKVWASSFRKMDQYKIKKGRFKNFLEYYKLISRGKSDIFGNYPIVIGIKKGAVRPIQLKYPGLAKFEIRTTQTINPSEFTHIEVPAEKIDETRKILMEYTSEVPIIALN